MEGRNQVFQHLKPSCVSLSQNALALNGPRASPGKVSEDLEQLKRTLTRITSTPNSLDPKLADYVFFPVSQILKLSQRVPLRCLELSLECIAILLEHGWRQAINTQLAAQIVILCTLMAEKKPKGFTFKEASDELRTSAFNCLRHAFSAAGTSAECVAFFRSEGNFPQLGQTISTVLDGVAEEGTVETQLAATEALQALIGNVADREICASFLPGIVSKLVKILTPSTKQRRNHRVLVGCLGVLGELLRETLDNGSTTSADASRVRGKGASTVIDEKWKQSAAIQLKPALSSVMRLKEHSKEDVREALSRLCLLLLEHCRESLADCSQMAVETLLTLPAKQEDGMNTASLRLEMLLRASPGFASLLQSTMHDWLQSLPTVMQSADEQAKVRKFHQISSAYALLVESGMETGMIERMLAGALKDSVVTTLQEPNKKPESGSPLAPIQSLDLVALENNMNRTRFGNALVKYRGQEGIMSVIETLARSVSSADGSAAFATDLARSLRYSIDETQVANFWLLFTATQNALQRKDNVHDLFDFGRDDSKAIYQDCLEEMYAFALSTLSTPSENGALDTRVQRLALRTLALRAQTAGQEFRYELIDALYPVLHTLATPEEHLQQDSIITLNIFKEACDYPDIRALIVENVDYLTNAVALKLNSFDVSPQAPQVLLMMVRLAGRSLLPYLEDTVESIFAALEDYHGYPLLVEVLFKVLGVMAEEGAKAPLLAIAKNETVEDVVKERWKPIKVEVLAETLRELAEEKRQTDEAQNEMEKAPQRPWKGIKEVDATSPESDQSDEDDALDQQIDEPDSTPPAPKTYNLLFKITELTQHFLPSASPSLRTSLLSLVRTTIPAIARHENSFLPLINTLWPEIVSRLDDAEPHVQAFALEIVGILCEHAGGFMRTRISQLWPGLLESYKAIAKDIVADTRLTSTTKSDLPQQTSAAALVPVNDRLFQRVVTRMYVSPADYSNTSTRLVWHALVNTLTVIVKCVPLSPEEFDDVLEMLAPMLESRLDVRKVLERENADAVWLLRLKHGAVDAPEVPRRAFEFGKRKMRWAEIDG